MGVEGRSGRPYILVSSSDWKGEDADRTLLLVSLGVPAAPTAGRDPWARPDRSETEQRGRRRPEDGPRRSPRGEGGPAHPGRTVSDRATIRLLFVGRDRLCAETLRFALREDGMEVVILPSIGAGSLPSGDGSAPPDLVLIELGRDGAGLEVGERFLEQDPAVKVVGLTPSLDRRALRASASAGFNGYLTKDTPLSTFVVGLRSALAGRTVRRPSSPGPIRRRRSSDLLADQLTPREREVVAMLVEGIGNEQIGLRLHISPNTVRTHVQSVLSKLQLHSRLGIVVWALRHGMAGGDTGEPSSVGELGALESAS